MVIGAGCFVFMFAQQIVCWIYLLGALLFAAMQVNQAYEGQNPTIKRLKKIMTFADIFFVLAGLLMVDSANMWLVGAEKGGSEGRRRREAGRGFRYRQRIKEDNKKPTFF